MTLIRQKNQGRVLLVAGVFGSFRGARHGGMVAAWDLPIHCWVVSWPDDGRFLSARASRLPETSSAHWHRAGPPNYQPASRPASSGFAPAPLSRSCGEGHGLRASKGLAQRRRWCGFCCRRLRCCCSAICVKRLGKVGNPPQARIRGKAAAQAGKLRLPSAGRFATKNSAREARTHRRSVGVLTSDSVSGPLWAPTDTWPHSTVVSTDGKIYTSALHQFKFPSPIITYVLSRRGAALAPQHGEVRESSWAWKTFFWFGGRGFNENAGPRSVRQGGASAGKRQHISAGWGTAETRDVSL